MDQFMTNKISLKQFHLNPIFTKIKSNFITISKSTSKNILKKNKSSKLLSNRPDLKNLDKIYNIKSQLDQIGKEDSIFNNDKLITNIKLDTLDDITVNEILEETMLINGNKNNNIKNNNNKNKKYNSPKKNNNRSLTPFNKGKSTGKRNKKNNNNSNNINSITTNITNLTLELNCNKLPQINNNNDIISNKTIDYKKSKKKIIKPNQKNLNQFINKPRDPPNKNDNSNNNLYSFLMTPINNKNKRSKKINSNNSFSKLNDSCENTNDSMCLTSVSRIMNKSFLKGKSMDAKRKINTCNMHFPNKSSIKNKDKDKLYIEIKKMFTDKIQLNDDLYLNMTDLDKKNCINFLLEALKELFCANKINQAKNDEFKKLDKIKEKKIQEDKNEIKELKKEITKLNKIIKTNISNNLKLNQKVENMKILLEKEKNKNKKNNFNKRGITGDNKRIINSRLNYRDKMISHDTKRKLRIKSMDKINTNNNINNKIDENNYRCNQETQINEDKKINNLEKKEENNDQNIENKIDNEILLEKKFEKENKGLGNNSDCTNFSDANNGLVE